MGVKASSYTIHYFEVFSKLGGYILKRKVLKWVKKNPGSSVFSYGGGLFFFRMVVLVTSEHGCNFSKSIGGGS